VFVLTSDITIGGYKKIKPHEVKIQKSLFSYVDRATVKVPSTARLKQAGTIVTMSTDTAKLIKEGDEVRIDLGYNGSLKNEFIGFVSRVNFTTPVEIECEGYSYQLRKKQYLKRFKNTTLKELLAHLVEGTDITLSPLIPELKIAKWTMHSQSGTEVLEDMKKHLLVDFFFTGKELYGGLRLLKHKADVKYRLGWNVIKDGNLKLREAKNQQVIIHIVGEKADGTKVTGKAGQNGEVKKIKNANVTDQATLNAMAAKQQNKLSYDGYEGRITAFLQPYCEPGYRAVLQDRKYPERSGNYVVESIEVTYGTSGARRIVGIGEKLS
jgi:hypothetical protein